MRCPSSQEVTTLAEAVAEESSPATGDEVVDGINNLEKDTMHESWYKALQGEFQKAYFKNVRASAMLSSLVLTLTQLKSFLAKEYKSETVFPPSTSPSPIICVAVPVDSPLQ